MDSEFVLPLLYKGKRIRGPRRTNILLAAMPKSASTFLHRALILATGFESAYFAAAYGNSEQDIGRPRLIDGFG